MRSKNDIFREICALKGLTYVGIRGDPNSKVYLVGEAPGSDETRLRLPFVGASGKEQGRMLREAGWPGEWHEISGTKYYQPTNMCFTNLLAVQPPENKLPRLSELGIPIEIFAEAFFEQLRAFRPTIIIAAGATALGYLCPQTRGRDGSARIGSYRGSLLQSKALDWPHYVIGCPHPAYILRMWEERPIAVFCLERALEEWNYFKRFGELQPLPVRSITVQPDADTLIEFLANTLERNLRVSVDIELLNGMPVVYGIAISPSMAFSFSIWDYPEDKLVRIWRLLNEILRQCPQIGQNYVGFDCSYSEWLGLEPFLQTFESKTEDTLVMHHVLWPEFPHKLEFLGMQYTREPYWKDEGRKWKPRDGIRQLMHYNGLDAAVTYEVWEKMTAELEERSHARL